MCDILIISAGFDKRGGCDFSERERAAAFVLRRGQYEWRATR
jgi:hypothetical protein